MKLPVVSDSNPQIIDSSKVTNIMLVFDLQNHPVYFESKINGRKCLLRWSYALELWFKRSSLQVSVERLWTEGSGQDSSKQLHEVKIPKEIFALVF